MQGLLDSAQIVHQLHLYFALTFFGFAAGAYAGPIGMFTWGAAALFSEDLPRFRKVLENCAIATLYVRLHLLCGRATIRACIIWDTGAFCTATADAEVSLLR